MLAEMAKQNKLDAEKIGVVKQTLLDLGFKIDYEDARKIEFTYKDKKVSFFPYSEWFMGVSVGAGKGFNILLKKIKE